MVLGTLGENLLESMLAGKGVMRAGEGTATVGYGSKRSSLKEFQVKNFFLIPPHPLTNFEIKMYYQNEPKI